MGSSVFLQQTGHAIINSILQGAVVYLILSAALFISRGNAIVKYRLAQAAQLLLLALFVFSFISSGIDIKQNVWSSSGFYIPVSMQRIFNELIPYLAVLYFLILGVQCISFIDACIFTRSLGRSGLHKISYEYRLFTSEMCMHLSIKKRVQIFISDKVTSPLTIGFLKPLILIPFACINQLSPAQLEAVILHELSHIKRADYLLQIFHLITEKILFFNPFIKIISRIIDEERETSCDNMVIQFRFEPEEYAGALLAIARVQPAINTMALHAAGKKDQVLLKRIQKILQVKTAGNYFLHIRQTALGLGVVALVLFMQFGAAEKKMFISNVRMTPEFTAMLMNAGGHKPAPAIQREEPVRKSNYYYKPATVKIEKTVDKSIPHNEIKKINQQENNKPKDIVEPKIKDPEAVLVMNDNETASVIPAEMMKNVSGNKIVLTPDLYNQLLSYYNFKRMQYTIASVPADSISVKESDRTQNSYRKIITIEATDKNGEAKSFDIVVELYQ